MERRSRAKGPTTTSADEVRSESGNGTTEAEIELVEVVISACYTDCMHPTFRQAKHRLADAYNHHWSLDKLEIVAKASKRLCVQQRSADPFENLICFKDACANIVATLDDSLFPPELWDILRAQLEQYAVIDASWRSAYGLARQLHAEVAALGDLNFGHVCLVVQLCFRKYQLLTYRDGQLVPTAIRRKVCLARTSLMGPDAVAHCEFLFSSPPHSSKHDQCDEYWGSDVFSLLSLCAI